MSKLPLPILERPADNTMHSTWRRCPRLFNIQHVHGLKPGRRTSVALDWGALMHLGWKVLYDAEEGGPDAALTKLATTPFVDPMDPKEFRTRARALSAMEEYLERWWPERFEVVSNEIAAFVEEDGITYGGIMDLSIWQDGALSVMDHKTTKRTENADFFERDPGLLGYMWLAERLHGKKPHRFYVNRTIVHKHETLFERRPFPAPDHVLAEWFASVKREQEEMRRAIETDRYPINPSGCKGTYGMCPAWDYCHTEPGSRAMVLEADWIQDPWNFMTARDEDNFPEQEKETE